MPIDARHEFLSSWQPPCPELDRWIAAFARAGVRYEIRHRGRLIMIYTHRMVTEVAGKHSGMRRPRWCCGGRSAFAVQPEDWSDGV